MTRNTAIIFGCLASIVLLLLLVNRYSPRHYDWSYKFEFNTGSDQPWGTKLFDEVMQGAPGGYEVATTPQRVRRLIDDDSIRRTFLFVDGYVGTKSKYAFIDTLLMRGDNVIIADNFGEIAGNDSITLLVPYFQCDSGLLRYSIKHNARDTVVWNDNRQSYVIYYPIAAGDIPVDKNWEVLARGFDVEYKPHHRGRPVVVKRKIGKGTVIYTCMPYLFTNYAVTQLPQAFDLARRIMGEAGDRPIVKITFPPVETSESNSSPGMLDFFMGHRALNWALWLTLATVIIAMVFTARRRQRVIPVLPGKRNESLEMVRQLGAMMHRRGERANLVEMKFRYFVEALRRNHMIDLDEGDDALRAHLLATAAGIDPSTTEQHLREINKIITAEGKDAKINFKTMVRHINWMDNILEKLN